MKLKWLHLIVIQHDLPLCRGRYFQMSFLRETQLSPRVKDISGRKSGIVIHVDCLRDISGIFVIVPWCLFIFGCILIFNRTFLPLRKTSGPLCWWYWQILCLPTPMACPVPELVYPGILSSSNAWTCKRMFQTVGTQFRECGDIKDGVDTVCVGAAELKTLRPPGPPGRWCSKHDYDRLSWMNV